MCKEFRKILACARARGITLETWLRWNAEDGLDAASDEERESSEWPARREGRES